MWDFRNVHSWMDFGENWIDLKTEINEYNNEILERRAMNDSSNQHDANFASTNQSKSTKTE